MKVVLKSRADGAGVAIFAENKGKLRVKATRSLDGQAVLDARKELEYAGYGFLADHSNVFRDEDDRTVVTFSPYNAVLASGDRDHILSGVFNQFLSEKSEPAE